MAKQKRGGGEWREGETGEETGRTQIKERPSGGNNLVKYYGINSKKQRNVAGKKGEKATDLNPRETGI